MTFGGEGVLESDDGIIKEGLQTDPVTDQIQQIPQVLEVFYHHLVVLVSRGRPECLEGYS